MDFRIVWTAPALEDLEALVRYIAQDDATAAARIGDKIVDHVSVLASFPEIGPVYRRRISGDVRQITCRPFRIFYRIERAKELVEILHVWHGARQEPSDVV
jgi:plasmid stabilization system protein ParE